MFPNKASKTKDGKSLKGSAKANPFAANSKAKKKSKSSKGNPFANALSGKK